ncbi:lysosomal amino acid transporter 1 homolog isoform X3 [Brachyhypopomus gauderio]|uniref:lysosomal amino acid transporter 1 homolog isoform X3 n=1 Tax=Brachyhypopomus gauderio TaxID=698409 RepID=UPI004041B49C
MSADFCDGVRRHSEGYCSSLPRLDNAGCGSFLPVQWGHKHELPLPQWDQVDLGRTWGVCPGRQGHRQRDSGTGVPGLLHTVLHPIYTAVYYVAADLLMMSMYLYYSMKHRVAINRNRRLLNAVGVLYVLGFSASLLQLAPAPDPALNPALGSALNPGRAPGPGRTLLCVVERQDISIQPFTTKEIIGFVIGSLSSLLYLCSRLPQIYTNFKRKSTEGLSYFLFALVILGNSTYGLSVLIKNPDMGTGEVSYMVHHLPWLIGSLGTLLLDLVITVQFVKYRRPSQESCPVDEEAAALLSS